MTCIGDAHGRGGQIRLGGRRRVASARRPVGRFGRETRGGIRLVRRLVERLFHHRLGRLVQLLLVTLVRRFFRRFFRRRLVARLLRRLVRRRSGFFRRLRRARLALVEAVLDVRRADHRNGRRRGRPGGIIGLLGHGGHSGRVGVRAGFRVRRSPCLGRLRLACLRVVRAQLRGPRFPVLRVDRLRFDALRLAARHTVRAALLALGRAQIERLLHTLHARHDLRLHMLGATRALRALRLRREHRRHRRHLVERLLRRGLLGRAAARARAGHLDVQLRHRALDFELLIVRRTMRRDDGVGRQRDLVALQILLQQRFRVLAERARIDMVENRHVQPLDHPLGGFEAAIEEHRPDDGFECVREDRRSSESAAAQFAFAEPQAVRDIEGLSNFVQRLLLDEVRPYARQIAFVQLAEALKQKGGHRAIQNGIAEKLEPFVMRGTVTAMGQSLAQ
ncbi:hypothetical protein DO73_4817 [Burkholderia pseudomallei]|nr:hypothetical protein DO73_4817 [Burkholderia pseudomallei]